MLLSFRQGLVQHEASGFLTVTPSAVSLVVIDTPVIATIASGSKDYLHIEREPINQAWGPITPGVDQWLYWDISTSTAARSFGITLTGPVFQPTEPPTSLDLHWFDTTDEVMKVWNGARWVEKLRVFACKLSNGTVPVSMSPLAPSFLGSQVGINETSYAGQIMYDSITGKALKAGNQFVTTEDVLSVQSLTKSDVKFASMVIEAEAQQAMSAYTIVKFVDFGKIVHGDVFVANQNDPFGIIQQSCVPGNTVTVLAEGAISNVNWDWSAAGVNAPLYCDANGILSTVKQIPDQLPVALVIDTKTILFGAPKNVSIGDTIISTTTLDALTDVTITTPTTAQVLTYNGTQWVNSTLPAPITNLDALTDVELTTPVGNEYLKYNGTQWVNSTLPAPITNLDALTDVELTTPDTGDLITYDGTSWVNEPAQQQFIKYDGTNLFGPGVTPGGNTNIVYGAGALGSNTLGGGNVAIGMDALGTNPYSLGQVAIGEGTLQSTVCDVCPATDVVVGDVVLIVTAGDTDFTLIGAPDNNPGTIFTSTGGGVGTGTVVDTYVSNGVSNTAIGYYSQHLTTSGYYNVSVGHNSLRFNTTGAANIAMGFEAMYSNTIGDENVAIGNGALISNTSGFANVAVGNSTLFRNTTGTSNIVIGYAAGNAITTGSNNVIIGGAGGTTDMTNNIILATGTGTVRLQHDNTNWTSGTPISMTGLILPGTTSTITLDGSVGTAGQVLTSAGPGATPTWAAASGASAITWVSATERLYGPTSMSGPNSVAYGNNALVSSTTGARNTAVGHSALTSLVVGIDNVAVGYQAGKALTSSYNTAVGRDALLVNNSNYRNTSLGCASMFANTSGGYNTAVGTYALYSNISGSYNTAVGDSAGGTSPGSSNVFIGYQAGYSEAGSNKLYIANTGTSTPLIYGDFGTSTLTVNGRLKATTSYITPAVLSIYAGGVDVNALSSNNFKLTANANFILYNPTNLVEGMVLNFEFTQDATGSRTITYGTMYKFAIDSDKSLSTAASAVDFMSCYYNGTSLLCSLGKRFQ